MTKVQIYFPCACNNYGKSHKPADPHVKLADSHMIITYNFLPIDL